MPVIIYMGRPRKAPKALKVTGWDIKGTHKKGSRLDDITREQIRQTYALTGNKCETARRIGCGLRTVYNVLAEAGPASVQKQRLETLESIADKVHIKLDMALDHINEEDFTGRQEGTKIVDKPSLMQKGTIVGILADKSAVLEKVIGERRLSNGMDSPALVPGNVPQLLASLQNKFKSLMVQVDFQENPHVQELASKIKAVEAEIIEEETPIDFDNPSPRTEVSASEGTD